MKKNGGIKILASVLMLLIVIALIFNRALFSVKNYIDEKAIKLQTVIYDTSDKFFSMGDAFFSYKETLIENERLKKENMELKLLEATRKEVVEENGRLTALLNMKENRKYKKNLKFGRVIFKNINNLNSKFYIDLGTEDGIEIDMVVMYDDYLVGKILKVFEDYSEVEMITNSKSIVSSRSSSGILGIVRGSDEEDGTMYFEPSTFDDEIKEGEELFTSGISDIFPDGVKIGEIFKINKDKAYIFKSIQAKADFKNNDLKEVIVFKYLPESSKKEKK